jgi:hypothetical protein
LMLFDTYPEAVNAAMPFTELFGARTIYQYRLSYPGSVNTDVPLRELFGAWTRIPDLKIPWGLGHHTWVLYSDKKAVPGKQYLQILASTKQHVDVTSDFSQFAGKDGWMLFYDKRRSVFKWLRPDDSVSSAQGNRPFN